MEVISIERSTYEELLTSCNSFVLQMKAMAVTNGLENSLTNRTCDAEHPFRMMQALRQNGTLAYSQIEHNFLTYTPIFALTSVFKKRLTLILPKLLFFTIFFVTLALPKFLDKPSEMIFELLALGNEEKSSLFFCISLFFS